MDMDKLTKKRKAQIYRQEFNYWKSDALDRFGYFPIFQPFKETFLLKNLSGHALRLYIYLGLATGNKTGETWVSIETMVKYFGKSKRTISGWLKELEEARLITRTQLNVNEVAHTFLLPYGMHLKSDINSEQKIPTGTPIFRGQQNIDHMITRHPQDYTKYGHLLEIIIDSPKYISLHPSDNSIQYIGEFMDEGTQERVLVAVRATGNGSLFARTIFVMSKGKWAHYNAKGYIKKY